MIAALAVPAAEIYRDRLIGGKCNPGSSGAKAAFPGLLSPEKTEIGISNRGGYGQNVPVLTR